jgi:hypothetical protein
MGSVLGGSKANQGSIGIRESGFDRVEAEELYGLAAGVSGRSAPLALLAFPALGELFGMLIFLIRHRMSTSRRGGLRQGAEGTENQGIPVRSS